MTASEADSADRTQLPSHVASSPGLDAYALGDLGTQLVRWEQIRRIDGRTGGMTAGMNGN